MPNPKLLRFYKCSLIELMNKNCIDGWSQSYLSLTVTWRIQDIDTDIFLSSLSGFNWKALEGPMLAKPFNKWVFPLVSTSIWIQIQSHVMGLQLCQGNFTMLLKKSSPQISNRGNMQQIHRHFSYALYIICMQPFTIDSALATTLFI